MGFFFKSEDEKWDEAKAKVLAQQAAAKQPAPSSPGTPPPSSQAPQGKGQAPSSYSSVDTDYSAANRELAKKLWEKNNGKSLSRYQKGTDIITADLNSKLEATKLDWAREAYKAQNGSATDDQVTKWMRENQRTIDRQMYGALTKQAVDLGVDFEKKGTYQTYLADMVAGETPKDTRSFWQKTKDVGKTIVQGIVDTPIGLGAALTDEVLGTNLYKGYFGDRTSIKADNTSFIDKSVNLLGEQMAWLDVAFGIGTFLTAGTGAPVFASLSQSIKGGGKAIAKGIIKEGSQELFEVGLKGVFKETSGELIESLVKGQKGVLSSITELAAKEGMDTTAYMTKLNRTMKDIGKEAFQSNTKAGKNFMKSIDAFTSLDGLGDVGKIARQNRWAEALSDGLGLPTQFVKLGKEGNLLQRMTTKSAGLSFMGLGMNVAIPSTTLLPGVGDWFETTGLRLGGALASEYVKVSRTGMVEKERQKFIDQYGVDPEKTDNPALKEAWNKSLDYKMRYALPSEILTGQKFSERGNAGQLLWGAFDAAANFAGVMAGIHGVGKAYGFTAQQMSPIKMDEAGNMVSNIGFIRDLTAIHNMDVDEATKAQKIDELKQKIAEGSPDILTSIRTTKELKDAVGQMQDFYKTISSEGKDVLMPQWKNGMESVVRAMEEGNMEKAIGELDRVNREFSEVAGNLVAPETIKRVNDKIDVMSKYFESVQKDHSFLSNLTKQFLVNIHTNEIRDPTGAMIRGTDELTAAAKSVFRGIEDINKVLVDTYTAKGDYIAKRYKESFDKESPLDNRIQQMLEGSGMTPTREMIVAMRFPIVTALTKTQFEMKKFQQEDLGKVFDQVFTEYGTDLNRINSEKSLGEILRSIESGNIDTAVKLSEDIEKMMNDNIVARKSELNKHKEFLQGNAIQIAQMDKLFTDLTTQLHNQRSRERVEQTEFVRTEESTVAIETEKLKAIIDEKTKEGIDTAIEKEILGELEKNDPEATVLKDTMGNADPLQSPTAHKAIVSEPVQEKITDENDKATKKINEIERETAERRDALQGFFDSIFRSHLYEMEGEKIKSEKEDFQDIPEDKEMDNFYKNEQRIRAYDDMIFRGIAEEYNKTAKTFFDQKGELDFESLKKFTEKKNQLLTKEQEKIYKEIAIELSNETPNKAKLSAKARKIQEIINEQNTKNFTRKTIVGIAKEAPNVEIFRERLEKSIKDTFKFTDEAVEKFMTNQFGKNDEKIIPFYQLYKKQTELSAFKVSFDLKDGQLESTATIFSREDPLSFTDEFGNTTLNRLEGLGTKGLNEKYDVLSLDDISINGAPLESYWVTGIKGEKIEDKKAFYSKNIMPAIVKEMESNGYIFLGDFQEEGKKRMFVKAREGETNWNQAMMDLTGVDFNKVEGIEDPKVKNQIISNLQKYSKLLWWGEINADKGTWDAARMPVVTRSATERNLKGMNGVEELITSLEQPRSDQVRHLIYEDNAENPYDTSGKPAKEKVSDGRSYNINHYAITLNKSIGTSRSNNLYKTATLAGPGQFIKSQDIKAGDATISDVNIVNAMYKSQDPKMQALMKFAMDNYGENWHHNAEAVTQVHKLIQDYRIIDRIVPLSAYKNIFTRKVDPSKINFDFENYKDGDILEVPLENIGVKAIDFYKSPEQRANETIKFSNQVIRNIHEIEGFSREEANQINDIFNQIRKDDYEAILDLAEQVGDNPNLIISEIEKRFGLSFNYYQKSSFITMASAGNLEKFLTNVMKKGVTTGTNLKGNQIDLTALPNHWEATEKINAKLPPEMKDNWIVLSREYYGHLDGDRYMMFRYPVVSDKVINSPKIIWAEDLSQDMGIDIDVGSSAMAAFPLIKKIEGDFDGDKVVLVTDPRLKPVQHLIDKFADQPKFDFEVDNSSANIHDTNMSVRDLWYETAYDTFEGKANIGILDNKISELERLMQMGVIKNDFVRDAENPYGKLLDNDAREGFTGSRFDYLRQVLGVTLQRAVDNKSINITTINKIINDSIGVTAKDITRAYPDVKLYRKNEKGENVSKSILLPSGKKVELWQIRLLGSSPGAVNFLRSIAMKADKGEYKLSDAEYLAYKKVSSDEFQKNIKAVQQIIKKKDFFNDDKIQKMLDSGSSELDVRKAQQKDITKIRKDYIEVKKAYDELVSFYGKDIIDRDPQMRFIGQMESSFLREFPSMREKLKPTLAMALDNVKEKFPVTIDSSVAKDFKALFQEYYSKERDGGIFATKEEYEQSRDKKLSEIEDKIYALAESHKIADLDPIIIANLRDSSSNLKNIMSAEGRENLDRMIHAELTWTPLDKLKIYDSTVDISPLYTNLGKVDPEEYLKIMQQTMGEDGFSKYFQSPRYQFANDSEVPKSYQDMAKEGIHPETFKEFSEVLKNADSEESARVVDKILNITEDDLKVALDLMKETGDTEGTMALLMSMGYKDIAGEKLGETTRDAYTNLVNSPFTKPNC